MPELQTAKRINKTTSLRWLCLEGNKLVSVITESGETIPVDDAFNLESYYESTDSNSENIPVLTNIVKEGNTMKNSSVKKEKDSGELFIPSTNTTTKATNQEGNIGTVKNKGSLLSVINNVINTVDNISEEYVFIMKRKGVVIFDMEFESEDDLLEFYRSKKVKYKNDSSVTIELKRKEIFLSDYIPESLDSEEKTEG